MLNEELNRVVLEKGFFASIKGHLLDKRAIGLSKGVGGGRILSNWKLFLTILVQIKFSFSKRTLFNEVSDAQMLYLSKIGTDDVTKYYQY